ncbi:hypothetical protein D3C79_693990 [compost metagenome]
MQRLQRRGHDIFFFIQRYFVGRARAFDQLGKQEQCAQRQSRAHQIEQRSTGQCWLGETDGAQQGAGRYQDAQCRQALEALGRENRHRRDRQGNQSPVHQPLSAEVRRGPGLAREQQCPQAQHGIQAHFGHDGEQCGNRRAGRRIGGHQPEIERPDAGLDQKCHGQDRRARVQQATVSLGYQRNLQGQVSHVQRACHAIEHGRAHQEKR